MTIHDRTRLIDPVVPPASSSANRSCHCAYPMTDPTDRPAPPPASAGGTSLARSTRWSRNGGTSADLPGGSEPTARATSGGRPSAALTASGAAISWSAAVQSSITCITTGVLLPATRAVLGRSSSAAPRQLHETGLFMPRGALRGTGSMEERPAIGRIPGPVGEKCTAEGGFTCPRISSWRK